MRASRPPKPADAVRETLRVGRGRRASAATPYYVDRPQRAASRWAKLNPARAMYTAKGRLDANLDAQAVQPAGAALAHQMIAKLPANVELDDLIQVGMIGRPTRSAASTPRRACSSRPSRRSASAARCSTSCAATTTSRGTRKQQRSIESAVHKLEQKLGRAPSESEIAREMGLSLTEYQELLGKVRGTQLVYLEDMSGDEGDNDFLDRHVADEQANPLAQLQDHRMREALVEAIKHLPEREQYVMSMYYEHDMNLKGDRGGAQGHRVARLPAAQPVDRAPARETREY